MKGKVYGLDSIRFFCALWVVFWHSDVPPLFHGVNFSSGALRYLVSLYQEGILFNGQAAVTLFFIISGFCIHYPQTREPRLHAASFYARRLLRIGIPWVVVEAGIRWSPGAAELGVIFAGISWTLRCEVAYYLIYPLLLQLAKKGGWARVLGWSFAASGIATVVFARHYAFAGFVKMPWNMVIGLPSWVLGCVLAEHFSKSGVAAGRTPIWLWRGTTWLASVLCLVLMLYTPVNLIWSLNFFAILGYFYLRAELDYYQYAKPVRGFELLGMASYSMYLIHVVVIYYMKEFVAGYSAWAHWAAMISMVFAGTGVYYLAVEYPSHQLARKFRATGGGGAAAKAAA